MGCFNCGGNSCWIIILLLLFCGGNNDGCGCGCGCNNGGFFGGNAEHRQIIDQHAKEGCNIL